MSDPHVRRPLVDGGVCGGQGAWGIASHTEPMTPPTRDHLVEQGAGEDQPQISGC